ncbi:hypothetical protein [Spirochaeta africana]|uniref:Uncharacterized protein n=1 Tax=Spirochaeta africana (strain ATCC 700263 / DSM 8902 / Z-7692) TaxID=889378 RepID=H9UG09_SPIAZ|nr:hypothetical protein [Spirochaeta africana]AFG36452.1 hypothetical protein Spiaf_0347 [Spirochaeta africana DSM 8902]
MGTGRKLVCSSGWAVVLAALVLAVSGCRTVAHQPDRTEWHAVLIGVKDSVSVGQMAELLAERGVSAENIRQFTDPIEAADALAAMERDFHEAVLVYIGFSAYPSRLTEPLDTALGTTPAVILADGDVSGAALVGSQPEKATLRSPYRVILTAADAEQAAERTPDDLQTRWFSELAELVSGYEVLTWREVAAGIQRSFRDSATRPQHWVPGSISVVLDSLLAGDTDMTD